MSAISGDVGNAVTPGGFVVELTMNTFLVWPAFTTNDVIAIVLLGIAVPAVVCA